MSKPTTPNTKNTTATTKPVAKAPATPAKQYQASKQAIELCEILRTKRPHGSDAEQNFVNKYIRPLPEAHVDGFGNYHVIVPFPDDKKPVTVMFSAHTDTVHDSGGTQEIVIDGITSEVMLASHGVKGAKGIGQCLGADDGTGCWLLMNMIKAKVPGYYIFHRAEECGGQGSAYIRDNWTNVMANRKFTAAIAFDRKGMNEIIISQSGTSCASYKCANQLKEMLKTAKMDYETSVRGSFTDTANYKYLIPECFNLAVGYNKQHGPNETQNLRFAERLLKACLEIPWHDLKAHRDHKAAMTTKKNSDHFGYGGGYGYGDDEWDTWGNKRSNKKKSKARAPAKKDFNDVFEDASTDMLIKLITQNPMATLMLLKEMQVTDRDILDAIEKTAPQTFDLYNEYLGYYN